MCSIKENINVNFKVLFDALWGTFQMITHLDFTFDTCLTHLLKVTAHAEQTDSCPVPFPSFKEIYLTAAKSQAFLQY